MNRQQRTDAGVPIAHRRLEVTMATQKCAHPACECVVDGSGEFGKYCSEYCKRSGQQVELHCNCQHPGCK